MSFLARYRTLSTRGHLIIVLFGLGLCALSIVAAKKIEIDTRIQSLLPKHTPTQLALKTMQERVASDGPIMILVASDQPNLNRELAEKIAEEIRLWPEARWVATRRDFSALRDAALLYLDTDTLRSLTDDIEARVDWEYCERIPGCVNFDDQPSLPSEEELIESFSRTPSGRALEAFTGEDLPTWFQNQNTTDHDDENTSKVGYGDELCSPEGDVCVVRAELRGQASDLSFATEILRRTEDVFTRVRPADAPASLRMVVSGGYRNLPMERKQIGEDLRNTAIVSVVLIVLVLMIQFRRPLALFLLLAPLLCGMAFTLGMIAWFHPKLNLISAFTLAILAGIGVDFGIHLLTYFGIRLDQSDDDASKAVHWVTRKLFSSLLAAGLTTGCAFLALSASSFRGISEMGWMAALGVLLSLITFLFVFPSLTIVASAIRDSRKGLLRTGLLQKFPIATPKQAKPIVVAFLLFGVVAAGFGTQIAMEKNFDNLKSPNVDHGIPSRAALRGVSGAAVYLLASDANALQAASESLLERNYDDIAETGMLLSPSVLLPTAQEEKLPLFERIRSALSRLGQRANEQDQKEIDRLKKWVALDSTIGEEALPEAIRSALTERDGTFGRLGMVYLQMNGRDAGEMEKLSHTTQTWRERYPDVEFASPGAMLGEVLAPLQEDAWKTIFLALLGLAIATAFLSSIRRTGLVLLPVLLAVVLSVGAMVLIGLKVNLYNVIVFPVAFGIGIDGAVYIAWATAGKKSRDEFRTAFQNAARAVLGSGLTSLCAFGSLTVASNPGLASLGTLAIITIALTMVTNLIWLPSLLVWFRTRNS